MYVYDEPYKCMYVYDEPYMNLLELPKLEKRGGVLEGRGRLR